MRECNAAATGMQQWRCLPLALLPSPHTPFTDLSFAEAAVPRREGFPTAAHRPLRQCLLRAAVADERPARALNTAQYYSLSSRRLARQERERERERGWIGMITAVFVVVWVRSERSQCPRVQVQ